MANVFLSYDHEDLAPASALAKALEQAGHTVWYDRHIHGGAQYSRKIEQALDAADAVLVLWSERSLDSPWVRDEAAEGRDRGKLIPLSLGGAVPPMGFRQFQTVPLGSWKGRGKVPKLDLLLEAVDSQTGGDPTEGISQPVARHPGHGVAEADRRSLWPIAAALAALLGIGLGGWWLMGRQAMPVVAVVAGDSTTRSAAGANDLYVKLGSLAQVGEGKWQLVDVASRRSADLLFRTADQSSPNEPRANLVLVDGKKNVLLWSREFSTPGATLADLRLQLSLAAGQVLSCALESRAAGGLKIDLMKRFLDACAESGEAGVEDPGPRLASLRAVLAAEPRFRPAWERLLDAEMTAHDLSDFGRGNPEATIRALRSSVARAEKIDPDMPALMLAKVYLMPQSDIGARVDALRKAVAKSPTSPKLHVQLAGEFSRAGLMNDALQAAREAAELDPLSPAMAAQLIMALAYAGRKEEAEAELAEAARRWAGTAAVRDATWAYHLRYGDPAIARRNAPEEALPAMNTYLAAREANTPAASAELLAQVAHARTNPNSAAFGWGLQALAEFGTVEEAFDWLAATPTDHIQKASYLLFRPQLDEIRRDRRFMAVAHRIGLVQFWRESGRWPDFCRDSKLPYDCKAEAAKLG